MSKLCRSSLTLLDATVQKLDVTTALESKERGWQGWSLAKSGNSMLVQEMANLKGACHKAIIAATASLTTRLPCSLLPLPLSVTIASRIGKETLSLILTRNRNRMSQQNRLSMATPAVMAWRLISARAGTFCSSHCCCEKWPSDNAILKRLRACAIFFVRFNLFVLGQGSRPLFAGGLALNGCSSSAIETTYEKKLISL